jgi:hypothetical protein
MKRSCEFDPRWVPAPAGDEVVRLNRRTLLSRTAAGVGALTAADFLRFFLRHGAPPNSRDTVMAAEAARAGREPRFLIYWYLEGGWESYDMFSPVMTPNHIFQRLDDISKERYRVLNFGKPGYGIYKHGNIRYGYLAEAGKHHFPHMAVLSSMHTGSFHSGERLNVHMGSYNLRLQADREEDERSVMQAFAEVYGQPYVLPNLSWHYWLSDGELNEVQYTGRKGYYHALGPAHAHTIYAGTPANLKQFLMRMQQTAGDPVNREIQKFLDDTHQYLRSDQNLEVVKSYNSAREIYLNLAAKGLKLDESMLGRLFTDPELRERFEVSPEDELITYRSVNGNKARTKFSPRANVQAMMTYELMRAGLGCAFFIESRDIRRFDSHFSRASLWQADRRTPRGQPDQTRMMNEDLWKPLNALVELLHTTPCPGAPGKSLFDCTTIVLTSEFGRTIHGEVDAILKMKISDEEKQKMIDGQDISQHWKVTSAAFLGGTVQGNRQYGGVGENTLLAIPLLPDGSMDPAYDPNTGELKPGMRKDPRSSIPNHGDVYATALYLSDINPKGRGRNDRPPLTYIKKGG